MQGGCKDFMWKPILKHYEKFSKEFLQVCDTSTSIQKHCPMDFKIILTTFLGEQRGTEDARDVCREWF